MWAVPAIHQHRSGTQQQLQVTTDTTAESAAMHISTTDSNRHPLTAIHTHTGLAH